MALKISGKDISGWKLALILSKLNFAANSCLTLIKWIYYEVKQSNIKSCNNNERNEKEINKKIKIHVYFNLLSRNRGRWRGNRRRKRGNHFLIVGNLLCFYYCFCFCCLCCCYCFRACFLSIDVTYDNDNKNTSICQR